MISAMSPAVTSGEALELAGDGLTIITYTAEPGSPSAEALRFLQSWAVQTSADQPKA